MKINNFKISIPNHDIETIDKEIILYNSKNKKIICFNQTASLIWNIILTALDENKDITTEYVVNILIETYKVPLSEKVIIFNDVQEIIDNFISQELILLNV